MERRLATRTRILDAGREVFGELGYHLTRVDEIVRRAEISRATFYLHFANKGELFAAIVDEVGTRLRSVAHQLDPVSPDGRGHRALREWFDRLYELVEPVAPFIAAWMQAERVVQTFGRDRPLLDFGTAVGHRISTGGAVGVEPRLAGIAILAMVDRFAVQVRLGDLVIDRGAAVELLADLTLAMLHPGIDVAATAAGEP